MPRMKENPRNVADKGESPPCSSRPALLHEALTREIIGSFYSVYSELRFGFLESVYRDAMMPELRDRGLTAESEAPVSVLYRGREVGHSRADILVERRIVLELKACATVGEAERRHVLDYLRGTNLELGLLLHFGPRPAIARVIMRRGLRGPNDGRRRSAPGRVGGDPRPRFQRAGAQTRRRASMRSAIRSALGSTASSSTG